MMPSCYICGGRYGRYHQGVWFCPNGHVLYATSPVGKQYGLDKLDREQRIAIAEREGAR